MQLRTRVTKVEFTGTHKQAVHLEFVLKAFMVWEELVNSEEMTEEMIDVFNEIVGNEVLYRDTTSKQNKQ